MASSMPSLLFLVNLWVIAGRAFQLFTPDSVTEYPSACGSILSQNITQCNPLVSRLGVFDIFDTNTTYSEDTLNQTCTSDCTNALSSWYSQASDSCSNVTYITDAGTVQDLSFIIGQIGFTYNQTCLTYGGQYCNIVLGDITASNSTSITSECNTCELLLLQNVAQSPYGDGPLVFSESLYQSYTSACSYTGSPLTASPTSASFVSTTVNGTQTATVPITTTTATCTGTSYTVQSGDTCDSIALSQGTATNWLLLDNALPAYCASFPQNGSLCINHPCKPYTVQSNDTCTSVAAANGITVTQLQTWNPWVNTGCYNFNNTIGTEICIDQPGSKYNTPSAPIGSPSMAVSAAPVPTDVAANTTTNCGRFYTVEAGDYCDKVVLKYSISLSDFLILNPAVNANCTNLYANESYCVEPVGDINNYPGSPFYSLQNPGTTAAPFTGLSSATYTPVIPLSTPLAAGGTDPSCYLLAPGDILMYNYSAVSDCSAASLLYNVTLADLQTWNPSLDTNSTDCSFNPNLNYCVSSPAPTLTPTIVTTTITVNVTSSLSTTTSNSGVPTTGSISTTGTPTTSSISTTGTPTTSSISTTGTGPAIPSPTQDNSISQNCNAYAEVPSGDGCYDFATAENIAPHQLYNWNQVLGVNGANCGTQLEANVYYCIGVTIPSPVQSGSIPENCEVYAEAQSGDYCSAFAQSNNITTDQLYTWNTVLGDDGTNCNTEFQANTYYCIGVNGQLSTTNG